MYIVNRYREKGIIVCVHIYLHFLLQECSVPSCALENLGRLDSMICRVLVHVYTVGHHRLPVNSPLDILDSKLHQE